MRKSYPCVLYLSASQQTAMQAGSKIHNYLRKKEGENSGNICLLGMPIWGLEDVLLRNAPMSEYYGNAGPRLVVTLDNTSAETVDRLEDELAKYSVKTGAAPRILRMSEIIAAECKRQNWTKVWVQQGEVAEEIATEPYAKLSLRLQTAGVQVMQSANPTAILQLQVLMAGLKQLLSDQKAKFRQCEDPLAADQKSFSLEQETVANIIYECQEKLEEIATETGAEVVALDKAAAAFLQLRKRTTEWGPPVLPAYELYLSAVAEWLSHQLTRPEETWTPHGSMELL